MEKLLGHQVTPGLFEATVGSRIATVLSPGVSRTFVGVGLLEESVRADEEQAGASSATVQLRLNRGGMRPFGLVSGSFEPEDSGRFVVEVLHSGDWPKKIESATLGLNGECLSLGLPFDFAQSVVDGLIRFGDSWFPAGRLRVVGAAFDEVDSSESIFELTAGLLKFALLKTNEFSEQLLIEFLSAGWGG